MLMPFFSPIVITGEQDILFTVSIPSASTLFTIKDVGGTYNATIDWGDGSPLSVITVSGDPDLSHTYASAGTYQVRISGIFQGIRMQLSPTQGYIVTFDNFGSTTQDDCYRHMNNETNLTTWTFGDGDMSGVTRWIEMFRGCTSLTSVDFTGADFTGIGQASALQGMFYGCTALTTITGGEAMAAVFTTWPTATMWQIFYNCTSLTDISFVESWSTGSVTTIVSPFQNIGHVGALDLSGWDLSSAGNFSSTFRGSTSITSIDLSNGGFDSATGMSSTFLGCTSLTTIGSTATWNPVSLTSLSDTFNGCTSLTSVDMSCFDVSPLTTIYRCFNNCSSLTSIGDISGWNITGLTTGVAFLGGTTGVLSTAEYDAVLVAWEAQTEPTNISVNFGDAVYTTGSAADTARSVLISTSGWTITDGGGT